MPFWDPNEPGAFAPRALKEKTESGTIYSRMTDTILAVNPIKIEGDFPRRRPARPRPPGALAPSRIWISQWSTALAKNSVVTFRGRVTAADYRLGRAADCGRASRDLNNTPRYLSSVIEL
ncbi:hypothetical protein EVAR_44390_1 [Eumeta japonica]|uniref:Uncharacterized protein n=1 Tax=Eumeta variegata TaxID=151549 RepID=A0A4C1XU99_EUMVA|nr:hypothetical protein EVAR_44390_1 [Eumeta japonica]